MRAILMAAAMVLGACSGGVTPGDDDVDATPPIDAAIDAGCGTVERNAECVHACDPFVPSPQRCGGATTEQCVAECSACTPNVAWCP